MAYDARLKRLVLTPKALALHDAVMARIRAAEGRAVAGIEPRELEQFFAVIDKIRKNLE